MGHKRAPDAYNIVGSIKKYGIHTEIAKKKIEPFEISSLCCARSCRDRRTATRNPEGRDWQPRIPAATVGSNIR